MADDEMTIEEEVSDAEKLAIVQHLLLSAPPGQLEEVKTDTLGLVAEDLVSPEMMAGICRAYNTANLEIVEGLVLCKEGEVDATHYVDPRAGIVLEVDHVGKTGAASEVAVPEAPFAAERGVADEALKAYVDGRYGEAGVVVYGKDDGLFVAISGKTVNLRNYWSGSWRSTWTLELSSLELKGTLKIWAHYFEDGNVQLQTTKNVVTTLTAVDKIADAVEKADSDLQQGLEDMYANMTHETFKAMRRVMPITRTKMKWNINEVALNKNLRK